MRREEGETSSSIPRHPRSPVVGPLEDDDLLLEILLRLPPQPSSLPRASAVCRRWHLLISEPGFSRRFRRYHRGNLPIIGFYDRNPPYLSFVPALEGPDRIPPGRLSWQCQREEGPDLSTFGCRDGLVLVHVKHLEPLKRHVLVWDPITGEQHNPGIPPGFDTGKRFNGAVFRSAGDADHFQVVLVGNGDNQLPVASVYSSETDREY
uniref:F-box domain-containing protein n=1 Tax=Aegilops tauschii TaxID=37682 RepID=M8CXP4_AEGTA